VAHADVAAVASLLSSGLLPVLHGDAVLDSSLGCTILSGDTIIRHLAEQLRPQFVVFLTNVEGVYDRPPEQSGAQLLRIIDVHQDGSWEAAGGSCSVQLSCSEHDTTGGIAKKVEEAAVIARLGIPVVIAKAGSEAARLACSEGPAAFLCAAAAGAGGGGDVGVVVAPPATVVRLV
jgi:isopentenyl phosphate kinase